VLRWALLGLAGGALVGLAAALGWHDPGAAGWAWAAALGATGAGGLVAAAAYLWRRQRLSRAGWALVFGVGALARLLLLPGAPHMLSDDAARYHWDGKVLASGRNPYALPPSSPRLDSLRVHALDAHINHPTLRTVYPPGAQLLFLLAHLLTPGSLVGLRGLILSAEVLTWALLLAGLRAVRRRRGPPDPGSGLPPTVAPPAMALLVVWSPLLLVEGYLPGHLDLLALPLLTAFVFALAARRPAAAGVALALACLIKPLPLVFVPVAVAWLGLRRSLRLLGTLGCTLVLAYLPFCAAGRHLFTSMGLMAQGWTFNATVAGVLQATLPAGLARGLSGALLLGLTVLAARRRGPLTARLGLCLAALAACSPVLFPWYVAWFVPLAALVGSPALVALVTLVPLGEVVVAKYLTTGAWDPPLWTTVAAFGPFYALLGWHAWRAQGLFEPLERRRPASSDSLADAT